MTSFGYFIDFKNMSMTCVFIVVVVFKLFNMPKNEDRRKLQGIKNIKITRNKEYVTNSFLIKT